jgi:hypothetical protein
MQSNIKEFFGSSRAGAAVVVRRSGRDRVLLALAEALANKFAPPLRWHEARCGGDSLCVRLFHRFAEGGPVTTCTLRNAATAAILALLERRGSEPLHVDVALPVRAGEDTRLANAMYEYARAGALETDSDDESEEKPRNGREC